MNQESRIGFFFKLPPTANFINILPMKTIYFAVKKIIILIVLISDPSHVHFSLFFASICKFSHKSNKKMKGFLRFKSYTIYSTIKRINK